MASSDPMLYWALIGIVLMLAELILPGGIVVFLGAACLLVAGAIWVGLVEGWAQSLTLWFISSIVLLLSFRQLTQRLVGGDSHVGNTDEELDLFNLPARVKETIGPGEKPVASNFRGGLARTGRRLGDPGRHQSEGHLSR